MLLPYHDQPAALLHFYLPPDSSLTSHQVEVLSGLAPSITLGLNSVRPQGEAIAQATATDAERRRIARHLHDNLGQNLSYLRFKLDQLSGDDARGEIVAVRQELEHMRDTANEAYEQVRDTLASLHPAGSGDLATALLAQARAVGRQVNFKVELTSEGQSRSLPPGVQRQALYLFREALINVGKHANAGQVGIDLMWAADTLTIKLADDGQGFEPDAPRVDGHYGLAIMHERAEEINGALTLASRPDAGTKVTLRLPLS